MNHLGKAPLIFGLLFLLALPVIVFRGDDRSDTLEFWIFAQTHYDEFSARIPAFEAANPGVKVELRLISKLHDKLLAAFLSGIGGPDLSEVEISSVGRFFKGTKEDIGFVDLTDRIEREGITGDFVPARLAPWSLDGQVYGLPRDVHPVVLLYRHDVYEEAGIDPASIGTWDDFVRETSPLARDEDGDGRPDRYPLMLSAHKPGHFWLLLLQNGGGMFDEDGGGHHRQRRRRFHPGILLQPAQRGATGHPGILPGPGQLRRHEGRHYPGRAGTGLVYQLPAEIRPGTGKGNGGPCLCPPGGKASAAPRPGAAP